MALWNGSVAHFFGAMPAKMREEDKRKHVAWSFWLTLLALLFMPRLEAFVLVFLVGFVKECWDQLYGSGFCMFDITGNLIGISIALAAALLDPGLIFYN